MLNYNDIKCFSNHNYIQKAEVSDWRTQYMHGGNLLFICGCFSRDLPLVSVTDVTNHLCAKLLRQHLVRDTNNWHLNTVDRKLNRALPFPTLLTPPKTITPSKKKTQRKTEDITKGEGKESEMLAWKSSSCLSNGAKQELASKRLKAGSLI